MRENKPEILAEGILVIRSVRKTIRMEISPEGNVILRAPLSAGRSVLTHFVRDHEEWIRKHQDLVRERELRLAAVPALSDAEIRELESRAKRVIPAKVESIATAFGVSYGKVRVRILRSRWGSCSQKGDLTFNSLLLLAPSDVLDSVIVHELWHREEMNHSTRFYALLSSRCPGYEESRLWLRQNGSALLRRIPNRHGEKEPS